MRPFDILDIEIYGGSHTPEIGGKLAGLPEGETFRPAAVDELMRRRKSGTYLFSTPRREEDEVVWEGCSLEGDELRVDGALTARIFNRNIRPSDYSYSRTPRPSHADYTAFIKDGSGAALSGGGRFSGRMTAPLVALGGVAEEVLLRRGIRVMAYIGELAGVKGRSYLDGEVTSDEIAACHSRPLPMLSNIDKAAEAVEKAMEAHDSVGGVVECIAYGVPAGLGDALFDGLESKLSAALFAVPAVKGVEFGAGFALAGMRGSRANDPFAVKDGRVITLTNNSGGINGGISNGMPLTMRAVFRPTPSISLPQRTVDLDTLTETTIEVRGRHDATVVPRAVAAVEAAAALAILDAVLVHTERKL